MMTPRRDHAERGAMDRFLALDVTLGLFGMDMK